MITLATDEVKPKTETSSVSTPMFEPITTLVETHRRYLDSYVVKFLHSENGSCRYYEMRDYNKVMGELMDRYCQDCGVSYYYTEFHWMDKCVLPSITPEKLGLSMTQVNVIMVVTKLAWFQKAELFFEKMNKIAACLQINREGNSWPFHTDILVIIFSYMSWVDLLPCTLVNIYWHMASQRYSMITQLECGVCGWLQDQPYPFWMHSIVNEYTWKLALSDSQEKQKHRKHWWTLSIPKEDQHPHYPLSKTVGIVGTLGSYGKSFAKKHNFDKFTLTSLQNVFFTELEQINKISPEVSDDRVQVYPPKNSKGFITEAVIPRYLNKTISLFSDNFSPNLEHIFPLMVYRRSQHNLDFRSTHTWVGFPDVVNDPLLVDPVGGVSWRLHKPLGRDGRGGYKVVEGVQNHLMGVLEVLFLAVRNGSRLSSLGGELVRKLKEVAQENNCPIIYVEIGYETPKANIFWKKNGLKEIDGIELSFSEAQMAFIENNCLRFNDTKQYALVHTI